MSERASRDVGDLNYMDIIGIVGETNRPPGGIDSVLEVQRTLALSADDHVLEIGTSTGFTAIELRRLAGCEVTAIDLNEESLRKARRTAEEVGVSGGVSFEQEDAADLPYDDGVFDVVFVGNVASYLEDRQSALDEFRRVLAPGGFLVAIPMYYHREPSEDLLERVRDAIGYDIEVTDRDHWTSLFEGSSFRPFASADYEFDFVSERAVRRYGRDVVADSDIESEARREEILEQYVEYLLLFRENLQHLRYSVLVYRYDPTFERELFTGTPVTPRRAGR